MFTVLSQSSRRPAIVQRWVGGQAGDSKAVVAVAEQTRGMVVRSSVKKMCPGCKVCLIKSAFSSLHLWTLDGSLEVSDWLQLGV